MPQIPVTAITAAILALIFVYLSFRVTSLRGSLKVGLGTDSATSAKLGEEASAPPLLITSRTHANFAEYVPLSLILLALVEGSGGRQMAVGILATVLIVARVAHAIGMARSAINPFRAGGITLQWLMLVVSAVYLLVLVVPRG